MLEHARRSGLRIAMIASSRYPVAEPFAGGLEAHVWHLTRALTGAGHRVTLFAAPGSDVPPRTALLRADHFEPSAGARADVSMPPVMAMREHHAYLSLMLNLAERSQDYDVIHNHSLHYLPIAMAPAVATPMVTTLHTPPTPWLESAMTMSPPTNCVAVSAHTAASWGHVTGPIPVIPNGIDADRWPVGEGGDDFAWFGRLVPEKGAHLAIETARLAGRGLRIAGPVSDREYFTTRIAPQLDDRIRYVGHLAQRDLVAMIGSSAVTLVTPRWDEPFGLVVAESLCCGTPVASFRRGGIPEFLGDAGILVDADDTHALASGAIAAAGIDRERVREHALRRCSEAAMLDGYQDLYAGLVDGREVRR